MNIADDVNKIFQKLPETFIPEKAGNMNAVVQLELTGEGGGHWILKVAQRNLSIDTGRANSPDLTLTMATSDYIALTRGEAKPTNLFMAGKIKVQGDIGLAMKFQELFARS